MPPTMASAPGTACTAARVASMVVYAAWLSGAEVSVPCRKAWPSRTTGPVTPVIPCTPLNADST